MSDLLAQLNPEQLAAVTATERSALILAGAGSGKTRVLTTRIAWLIQTNQVSPAGLIAVTFTNKAAREMLTRLSAMLPINTRGMWIGTFHGLCNRMLRAHYRDAGLPQSFQILDSADQLAALKRLVKAAGVDDEKYPPRQLAWFINGAKEQGLRAGALEATDDFSRKSIELYRLYDEQCQREGVVDFAELLLRCFELLSRNQPLREHYQARFGHVLVDEFQDTNVLQYRWLKMLAAHGTDHSNSVFAVGDDDQSIYAFRGANVGNMAEFEREFRVSRVIKLEQNYRSHGHILDAANTLIRNNHNRLGKNLWTVEGVGEPIRVFEASSDGEEARWIVDEVQALVRDGMSRSSAAILYRSNAQSRVLEHALFNAGIPYRVYGGQRFFERQEIKHALAYLRLMSNSSDDTAWMRVVNFPTRGIGARSLEQLQDLARVHGIPLWSAASNLEGKSAGAVGQFVRLIEAMRAETHNLPLPEIIAHVIERSGLIGHYQSEKEGQDRIANLNELVNAAASFTGDEQVDVAMSDLQPGQVQNDAAAVEGISPLDSFLSHASLEAGDNQAQEGQDALQLMTVHSAKGLEFESVFITGLEEGLFPHENSMAESEGPDEERRLMYVAITRARRRLYLSFSQTRLLHGQTRYNVKSRFFGELPEGSLKWLSPRQAPRPIYAPRGYPAKTVAGPSWDETGQSALPAPIWSDNKRAEKTGFRIGQNVSHAKFGEGVIVGLEGQGSDARAQVNFRHHGTKWLALSVARLDAI